jgi:hypothetical protein
MLPGDALNSAGSFFLQCWYKQSVILDVDFSDGHKIPDWSDISSATLSV